jgi:plastocyanin
MPAGRWLSLLLCGLVALAAVPAGVAAAAATSAPAKKKVTCRWVKATKKAKRHKVCVKRKVTAVAVKKKPAGVVVPASGGTVGTPAVATVPGAAGPEIAAPAVAPVDPSAPVTEPEAPVLPPAPARVQVTAGHFTLTLSRVAIPAGSLIAQLVNRDEDPHDLHLREGGSGSGGADLFATLEALPGRILTAPTVTVVAGAYTLYCALPGHEQAGMRATLTVQ